MSMIDPHVHLRDWNQKDKETMLHGFNVASIAGFTHLFDMPNTDPALTSRETILARLSDASEALKQVEGMHYHLYGGITSDPEQISEIVDAYNELFPLVVGLKLFAGNSTGGMGVITPEEQKKVFEKLVERGYKGVLAVHSEKESLLHPELFVPKMWKTHSFARPDSAEIESVRDIINLALECGFEGTLHIAHVSTKGAIELVKQNRDKLRITLGATPHHSLYNIENAKEYDRYLKMNPPLRSEEDREYVFSSLLDGTIDWVESDHAPHTLVDKKHGASGIPGFAGMLLLANRLREAGCTEDRLSSLFGGRAIEVFGLEKEDISVPEDLERRFMEIESEYPFKPYSWE